MAESVAPVDSIDSESAPTAVASEKSYAIAVSLAAVFGVMGLHHFYLDRPLIALFDLGLFVLALLLFAMGFPFWAALVFAIDWLHTFVVTIQLLVGSTKDGRGHVVCYPGQRLSKGN